MWFLLPFLFQRSVISFLSLPVSPHGPKHHAVPYLICALSIAERSHSGFEDSMVVPSFFYTCAPSSGWTDASSWNRSTQMRISDLGRRWFSMLFATKGFKMELIEGRPLLETVATFFCEPPFSLQHAEAEPHFESFASEAGCFLSDGRQWALVW